MIRVTESSQIAEARRRAGEIAQAAGLDETDAAKVALLVTELGSNLVKHARDGQVLLRASGEQTVEILSLDRGPGIANIGECMRDGYSTAGSPGTGLGALGRLSSECDIHSVTQKGTSIVARLTDHNARNPSRDGVQIGVVCLAKPGEEESGDGWLVIHLPEHDLCAVVDGLGHGHEAAKASSLALQYVGEHGHRSPKEILERVHEGVRSTRGAALSIAQIKQSEGLVRFAGIGNVSGVILDGDATRHMVSMNGTLGYQAHRVTEFTYPWSATSLLILHSDGLLSRWNLAAYPGLLSRDPSLIAGVLYRDFVRGRDDTTVLAVRARR
jgi:anti-sigma regulatory factor (Ser/Thr protein kinase)